MDMAVLSGALTIRNFETKRSDYLGCDWLPPKWDWVDPLKDANAEIAQINAGLKSRTQAIAERGYDIAQVNAEIAAERQQEAQLGISFQETKALPAPQPDAPQDEQNNQTLEEQQTT